MDDLDDVQTTDTLEVSMDGAGRARRKPDDWIAAVLLGGLALLALALLAAGVVWVWLLVL